MKIEFEKKVWIVKSIVLVVIFLSFFVYLGALVGRYFDSELAGLIVGVLFGVFLLLLVFNYPLYFLSILGKSFSATFFMEKNGIKIYKVKSKNPFSISFSILSNDYIFFSQGEVVLDEYVDTIILYESIRIQRGISAFNTFYVLAILLPFLIAEVVFFELFKKTIFRFGFAFFGNIMRVFSFPFLFLFIKLFYSVRVYEQNDRLFAITKKSSYELEEVIKYFYSGKSGNDYMYFGIIPLLFSHPMYFGKVGALWKYYVLSGKDRIRLFRNVVG